jgi:hypothetical protein
MTQQKAVATLTSIHVFCFADGDGVKSARLASARETLLAAEGNELLRIEGHGFKDDALCFSARHRALGTFLPFIECGGKFIPVIHDLPEALIVRAIRP